MALSPQRALAATMFLISFGLVLFELVLTRLFGIVLFASFAHLALALALLGISVGAVLQHVWPQLVPDEGLERRLGVLALAQGVSAVVATVATLTFPLTHQFEEPPTHYGERSMISWDLLDPTWFAALMPLLVVPFAIAGLAFAGAFHRRKEQIGQLYGADLIGGGVAGLAFIPLLGALPGPDLSFTVLGATALSALLLFRSVGSKAGSISAGLATGVALLAMGASLATDGLLKVRYAAGYSEDNVSYTEWTPITRIALHEDRRGAYVLLDNSSASRVVRSELDKRQMLLEPNRSLVYRLHKEPARVAIMAASAGPEVAVAQHYGHSEIDAIDIARIGPMVAERFPEAELNPFLQPGVTSIESDGRAAILRAQEPYDIIQMVHANLHSSAGLLANAWSPSLLETREAFRTYLEHLSPEGTLSFGRGEKTRRLARAAAQALRDMGVERPATHIAYISGPATLMLVKKRPWTQQERDELVEMLKSYRLATLYLDPTNVDKRRATRTYWRGALLEDDRPYLDDREEALALLKEAGRRMLGLEEGEVEAAVVVYHTLAMQVILVAGAGFLLLLVPLLRRGAVGLTGARGVAPGLLYVAGLGYGYLAIETVLIHELVLFVGHPTYALTVVILSMLLSSGAGSMMVHRVPQERLQKVLVGALLSVLVLGVLQAWVVPPILYASALAWPMGARIAITGVLLIPLGFVMGVPFSAGMRLLRPSAAGLVPWAWALNGWMSVVASLGTVLISRMYGYSAAFEVGLLAYAGALAMCWAPARVRPADGPRWRIPWARVAGPAVGLVLVGSVVGLGLRYATSRQPLSTVPCDETDCSTEPCRVHFCEGEFTMGSPEGVGKKREHPQRQVSLSAFDLAKTETTVAQYQTCVADGACKEYADPNEVPRRCNWGRPGREQHPMNCVDFAMAETYCGWVSGRLPTEAEWEYAARSKGQARLYPWGDEAPSCTLAAIKSLGCDKDGTSPVCSKEPGHTEQGLCDMTGNAFEWTRDWFHDNYKGAPSDGRAWEDPPSEFRTMRGGGIGSDEPYTTTNRTFHEPDFFYSGMGFRCAWGN